MTSVIVVVVVASVFLLCYGVGNSLSRLFGFCSSDGLLQNEPDANEWDTPLGAVAKTALGGIMIIVALCAVIVIVVTRVLGVLAVTVAGTKHDPEKYTWNRHST